MHIYHTTPYNTCIYTYIHTDIPYSLAHSPLYMMLTFYIYWSMRQPSSFCLCSFRLKMQVHGIVINIEICKIFVYTKSLCLIVDKQQTSNSWTLYNLKKLLCPFFTPTMWSMSPFNKQVVLLFKKSNQMFSHLIKISKGPTYSSLWTNKMETQSNICICKR